MTLDSCLSHARAINHMAQSQHYKLPRDIRSRNLIKRHTEDRNTRREIAHVAPAVPHANYVWEARQLGEVRAYTLN